MQTKNVFSKAGADDSDEAPPKVFKKKEVKKDAEKTDAQPKKVHVPNISK